MATEQDASQGRAADTDLHNARMKVALQFMSLQDVIFSHWKPLVNIFHFDRNFSMLIQNILIFARKG